MSNRNIIIAPCGNRTCFFKDHWLKYKEEREFDVCLLFYHETINDPSLYTDVDHFFHLKGFKYAMIFELFEKIHPEWISQYEYFYFLDDDIEIDTRQINCMFLLSRAMDSQISQASLSKDSFCSWPMFRHQRNSFCRFVGQIEVMAPLFNRYALKECLPSFIGNKSSWGIDSVWSKILGYPENKLLVFDTVVMKHTQPVGSGELYQKIGVDPHDDWNNIVKRYHAKKQNYKEYGRLQLVNSRHNRINYFSYKFREFLSTCKRLWKDYDIRSRINNSSSKLFSKKTSS